MLPDQLTEWRGLPVKNYSPDTPVDPAGTIYRLAWGGWDNEEQTAQGMLESYLKQDGIENTQGIILGMPGEMGDELPAFTAKFLESSNRFPNLKALFVGEIEQEESEISWIEQSDISKVLNAFPGLEELYIRGCAGTEFQPATRHICLKKLVIQSGGLPKGALTDLHQCVFPELEHLELWLGTDNYGGDATVDDVRPFLEANPFPKLKYLGLRNADIQNEIAAAVAEAPVLDQIEVLDLSLGVLRNEGAEALLASSKIPKLKKLDLHRHFMAEGVAARFAGLGIEVDVSEPEQADEWDDELHYYVSVSE